MSSLLLTNVGDAMGFSVRRALTPLAWYDATKEQGFSDGAAIVPKDFSGNGNDQVQATGSKQPLYKVNIQNGLPVFQFDGVDDVVQKAFTCNNPWTVFTVAKLIATGAAQRFIDGFNTTAGELIQLASSTLQLNSGGAGITLPSLGTTLFHSIGYVNNGASSAGSLDSNAPVSGTAGTNNAAGSTMGAAFNASQPCNCYIGEHIVCAGALSAGLVVSTMAYLKAKWGTP